MLMPKRVKRRKQFRGTMRGKATRGNKINYGEYGLVATEPCWIRSNLDEIIEFIVSTIDSYEHEVDEIDTADFLFGMEGHRSDDEKDL